MTLTGEDNGPALHLIQLSKSKRRYTNVIASVSEAIHRAANSNGGLLRRERSSQ